LGYSYQQNGAITNKMVFPFAPLTSQINMNSVTRIKELLKSQLQKGEITKEELLKIEPSHLMKLDQLKDIDQKTISETLNYTKYKLNPALINQDLHRLLTQQNNPLTDQISAIMKGLD